MQKTLFFLLISTVLLAACSPAAQDAPQASDDSLLDALDAAGADIDPVLREFMELEEKRAEATYTVEYTTTMSGNGETLETSMAEFQDGAAKKRTDVTLPGLGESRTYTLGDEYITCSLFTGSWRCERMTGDYEFEESEDSFEAPDTAWEEAEVQEAAFAEDGTMEVAGVTAQCYTADFGTLTSKQCLSRSGVTLYMHSIDAEGNVMEIRANSYKESVAASDFNPPAEPLEAGSAEAQEGSCRDACVMMEMSESECNDFCAMQAEYANTYPEGTEGDWSDTENYE